MANPSPRTAFQALYSDAEFLATFQPAALAPFVPRRGSAGLPPILVVQIRLDATRSERLGLSCDIPDFNDWQVRRAALHATGAACGRARQIVLVVWFASEAWMRLGPADCDPTALRNDPTVPTTEVVVVFGKTVDGRSAAAMARLHRTRQGRVRRVEPWDVSSELVPGSALQPLEQPLLDAFWDGYLGALQHQQGAP